MAAQRIDEAKLEAFMEKAIGDFSGTMTTLLCSLGDRLGLFKDLAEHGSATSDELAIRTGTNERYVREWLRGLTAAEYLERDDSTGRYTLPPEHAMALAEEAGPMFLGGAYQIIPGALVPFGQLVEAFKQGGGVAQDAYGPDLWEGMERFTAPAFEHRLLGEWLPALPHLRERLERGATVADIGCGAGRAVLKLAEAFPNSTIVGFDAFETQIERARSNANRAGLSDRVSFQRLDATQGLPGQYDIVTTFDVIHDAVNPRGLLKTIRQATKDEGSYLMLEFNCADRHEDNQGPLAAMFYGFSVFYCMTTSLANGGDGLGTCGMPEAKVRELCTEAGFNTIKRLPSDDPFDVLYEIT